MSCTTSLTSSWMMAQPGCLVLSYIHDDTTGLPAHTHAPALAQQNLRPFTATAAVTSKHLSVPILITTKYLFITTLHEPNPLDQYHYDAYDCIQTNQKVKALVLLYTVNPHTSACSWQLDARNNMSCWHNKVHKVVHHPATKIIIGTATMSRCQLHHSVSVYRATYPERLPHCSSPASSQVTNR